MAVTLKQTKDYLRIDEDLTEDDELIGSLIEAATDYLEQTTGKKYSDNSQLFVLAVKMLVAHWYENRSVFSTKTNVKKTNVNNLPHSIEAIITHISLAQYYKPLGSETS